MFFWLFWFFWTSSAYPEGESLSGDWPAEIRGSNGSEQKVLPLPLLFETEGISVDSTITLQIELPDLSRWGQAGVYAERPLRSILFRVDGQPIASLGSFQEGVNKGPGNQSLLVRIPEGENRGLADFCSTQPSGGLAGGTRLHRPLRFQSRRCASDWPCCPKPNA